MTKAAINNLVKQFENGFDDNYSFEWTAYKVYCHKCNVQTKTYEEFFKKDMIIRSSAYCPVCKLITSVTFSQEEKIDTDPQLLIKMIEEDLQDGFYYFHKHQTKHE
jgi:hypothetical protein